MKAIQQQHKLSYLEIENDAPVLLFIHGFPNNASMWNEQIQYFKKDFHIIAVNLPGSEKGEVCAQDEYAVAHLTNNLTVLLRSKGLTNKKIFIVGHDLGAFLAHEVSLALDAELGGVVFISGMPATMFKRRLSSLEQWIKSSYVIMFNIGIIRKLARKYLAAPLTSLVYALSKVPLKNSLRNSGIKGFAAIDLYHELTKHVFRLRSKTKNNYNSLFIFGAEEKFLTLPTSEEISKDQENFELSILPGGHWLPATHSTQVNLRIKDFFNKAMSA